VGIRFAVLGHVALCLGLMAPAWPQARAQLNSADALYPRVVRLQHNAVASVNGTLVASFTTFPAGGGSGQQDIYSSPDGNRFVRLSSITDPLFSRGLCCGTLYELPVTIGSMPAGTLLWAGSVGGDTPSQPMQLRIYRSADAGVSWTYLSNCATGSVPRSGGGLWEPEFTIAGDGSLVCYYSDETKPPNSQLIAQVHSTDGINWSAPVNVVQTNPQCCAADRPGMPGIVRLPSGTYFLSHELCGPAGCTVFFKTSPDGLDWGDPGNVGQRVETANNQWFQHTPTVAWVPSGAQNGTLLVTGQIFVNNGQADARNGRVILANSSADGSGAWTPIDAPVAIVNPPQSLAGNFCQNYSSPLLPSADGRTLLQFATDFTTVAGSQRCLAYFANGAIVSSAVSTLTMAATPSRIGTGSPVSLTATVSNASSAPAGTVEFFAGAVSLGTADLGGGSGNARTATLQIAMADGAHGFSTGDNPVTAHYVGSVIAGSASSTVVVTVDAPAVANPGGGGGGGGYGLFELLLLAALSAARALRRSAVAIAIAWFGVGSVIAATPATEAQRFSNPLLLSGPDPWVTREGEYYFYMHTLGDRLAIWKTRDITNLREAEHKTIWTPPASGPNAQSIWAPELHRIDGKWYVYYTAAASGHDDDAHRGVFVLENASADPLQGEWRDRGRINTRYTGIDGTTFSHAGQRYFIYSPYVGPDSDLAISRMSDPWTLTGPEVILARPDKSWERQGGRQILEGPEFLAGPKGDLFIVYSASACWSDDYALGMLRAAPGSDPLDAAAWSKSPAPVFAKSPEGSVFAPGHNGFFTSPDGKEHWIIYHANPGPDMKCTPKRSPRIQPFHFAADGAPVFGKPVGPADQLNKPE